MPDQRSRLPPSAAVAPDHDRPTCAAPTFLTTSPARGHAIGACPWAGGCFWAGRCFCGLASDCPGAGTIAISATKPIDFPVVRPAA
jgi:hypothetical protein